MTNTWRVFQPKFKFLINIGYIYDFNSALNSKFRLPKSDRGSLGLV
jgi:hypothetical protein